MKPTEIGPEDIGYHQPLPVLNQEGLLIRGWGAASQPKGDEPIHQAHQLSDGPATATCGHQTVVWSRGGAANGDPHCHHPAD